MPNFGGAGGAKEQPPGWIRNRGGEQLLTVQEAIQMRGRPHQAQSDVCAVQTRGEDLAATCLTLVWNKISKISINIDSYRESLRGKSFPSFVTVWPLKKIQAPTWQSVWERPGGFIVWSLSVEVTLVMGVELSGIDVVLRTSVAARLQKQIQKWSD